MERLVYAPKVNAWVKTDSGIVDLSDFIVSGTVNRKTNQVSGATLSFRNPKKENGNMYFTEHTLPDGSIGPMLHPMDPIIITLTRLRDRPIQVFTGYLDKSPYLALFPGVVSLEASCTLKRLQHTYWDPGVPFVNQFLNYYHWYPDPAHGGINSPASETAQLKDIKSFNDGSIGALLKAVLINVGGWDESIIYVEPLPDKIGPLVAKLFTQFQQSNKENKLAQDGFADLLTQLIGQSSQGTGGPTGAGNSKDFGNTQVPKTVYCTGVALGVSDRYLLAAMATGLVETGGPGAKTFSNPSSGDGTSVGWRQETSSSYPNVDRMDVRASSTRFYKECAQHDTGQAVGALCQDVQRSRTPDAYQTHIDDGTAQGLLDKLKKSGCK